MGTPCLLWTPVLCLLWTPVLCLLWTLMKCLPPFLGLVWTPILCLLWTPVLCPPCPRAHSTPCLPRTPVLCPPCPREQSLNFGGDFKCVSSCFIIEYLRVRLVESLSKLLQDLLVHVCCALFFLVSALDTSFNKRN